jgi:uncharacterized Ntn-hydrolase superfamily protein
MHAILANRFIRTSLQMTLLLALLLPCIAGAAQHHPPNIATFSVVAYDPATGEVGVAVQSRFFAVGTVVPWAQAGVGAVASQAYGNPTYGPRGLRLMAGGETAAEAIRGVLRSDKDAQRRQIGMVSVADERAATYTGTECMAWAGGKSGVAPDGVVYAVQGNILTGADVVESMARAMEGPAVLSVAMTPSERTALSTPDLAGRMLGALLAGEAAGGDSRGMQSAALKVCQQDAGYGGYNDVKYDLRVDDAVNPFDELARILNLARPIALANEGYLKLYAGDRDSAERIFEQLVQLQPDEASHHYNLACAYSLDGKLDAAMAELTLALAQDDKLRQSAGQDPDLTALRERADFKALVGTAESKP